MEFGVNLLRLQSSGVLRHSNSSKTFSDFKLEKEASVKKFKAILLPALALLAIACVFYGCGQDDGAAGGNVVIKGAGQ
jgi:hypothetical protein